MTRDRPAPRWRRPLLWGGVGVGVLIVVAVAWLGWTASRARTELTAARADLPAVQAAVLAGDGSAAARLDAVKRHAASADDLTHDPVWAVAAALPVAGSPLATTRGLTHAVHVLTEQSLPDLARAADTLHPAKLLADGGRLDVAGLAKAQPTLAAAADSLRDQRDAVAQLDPSWLNPVAQARTQLLDQLRSLTDTSRAAATAARLAPPMLGLNGPRRYFVAFQNPAEARGTGGLLDAFAIVVADRGAIHIERMGANADLPALTHEVTDVDAAFATRYGPMGATTAWLEANVSPNFPDVARAWEAMWRQSTGEQLDGALALDPHALSAVLAATGPVTAPVVGTVDAGRIEQLVLHDQYVLPKLAADNTQRKSLMLGVGAATIEQLMAGHVSARTLLTGLRSVAAQGHLMVQSRTGVEEHQLTESGIAGAVDTTTRPFAQAVVINAAGNKLDSWLSSSLRYRVTNCTGPRRVVALSVTLRNDAPTTGLPTYVTVRSDNPPYRVAPSQNRTGLEVLVTPGATLTSATLDGAPMARPAANGAVPDTLPDNVAPEFLQSGQVGDHPAFSSELELEPGHTHTFVLTVSEPASTASPLLPLQTLVRTPTATADLSMCTAKGEG